MSNSDEELLKSSKAIDKSLHELNIDNVIEAVEHGNFHFDIEDKIPKKRVQTN